MQTERRYDMYAEQEVSKFLCAYFYPVLFPGFAKETSLEMQYAGIDIVYGQMFIDEKCQLERINNQFISTQCLELCSVNKAGKFALGWYLDPRKKTTHYLFTWIDNCLKNDKKDLTANDILSMKAILVSVEKLKTYFASIGITDKILHKEMLNMCINKKADRIVNNKMYIYFNNNTRIVRTLSKKETPVNFVVPRHIYESCCDGKYIITKDSVTDY